MCLPFCRERWRSGSAGELRTFPLRKKDGFGRALPGIDALPIVMEELQGLAGWGWREDELLPGGKFCQIQDPTKEGDEKAITAVRVNGSYMGKIYKLDWPKMKILRRLR